MKILFLIILLLPIKIKALTASSYIVMDMDNLNILESQNMNNKRSIASISKIMTAILVIENNDINKEIVIGDEIKEAYGSGIYIKKDEKITIKDLLYGLMLRSGNDAALALAKNTSGSVDKFIDLMNKKAMEIGMKNTIFNNPHGLEVNGGNISTAYDMALLTSYAMKNSTYRKIVSTKKYEVKTNFNYYVWYNKNKLLHKYKFISGGKTGYTEIAKRTLVSTSSKNNINLVVVTLNDGNDFNDHIKLHNKYFTNYTNYKILKKGKINYIGNYQDNLYIKNDFNITLKSTNHNVLLIYKINKILNNYDNIVGKIEVLIDNKKIHEEIIYLKKENND